MLEDNIEDFLVVTDSPFTLNNKDIKLHFDVTWKSSSSQLIINCREISQKDKTGKSVTKIVSLTIPEFKGIHSQLSAVEPKIAPFFPEQFLYKTIIIERPNTSNSWNFFGFQSTTVLEDKEFSDDCIKDIQSYLQAVVEICGQQLLFNMIFKEENITYFEDNDEFISKKSDECIEKLKKHCLTLLGSHYNYVNLKSLTEEIYKDEDIALEEYKEIVYEGFLLSHTKVNENIEELIEKLKTLLINRQNPAIGPRIVDDLNIEISSLFREYYEKQRLSINLKLKLSKSLRAMYFSFLTELLKDKSLYEAVIYRDCAGERMKNISLSYYSENENCSYFKLLLHSTDDLILDRKIDLVHKWSEGENMIKPNVRHEDYSLIQLKHLNNANFDLLQLDKFYEYIKKAHSLLIDYYEARRVNIINQKQTLDDPIDVVRIANAHAKSSFQAKSSVDDHKDIYQSINISQILNIENHSSDEDFQDAMDEEKLKSLMQYENALSHQKNELQNELKRIANIKAELRNAKHQLEKQYKKLKNKIMETNDDSENKNDSMIFSSLHPEKIKPIKRQKPTPGSTLSLDQRKVVSSKASERIKLYKRKLKGIPENSKSNFPEQEKEKASQHVASTIYIPQPNLPPPPPPPSLPPPIPPSLHLQNTIFKTKLNSKSIISENPANNNCDYMKELSQKLSKRREILNQDEINIDRFEKKNDKYFINSFAQTLSLKLETIPIYKRSQISVSEDEYVE